VDAALKDKAGDVKYLAADRWKGDLADQSWLEEVDAAKLIKDVLAELTEHRIAFNKAEHSAQILDAIIETDATLIEGLADYLRLLADFLSHPSG
jgi:hypothetical protein